MLTSEAMETEAEERITVAMIAKDLANFMTDT
jgi:hypothetical protein